jgi:hypothetical protein
MSSMGAGVRRSQVTNATIRKIASANHITLWALVHPWLGASMMA